MEIDNVLYNKIVQKLIMLVNVYEKSLETPNLNFIQKKTIQLELNSVKGLLEELKT